MIGDNVTETTSSKTNYSVIDKDGKVTDFIWDDQQKTMVKSKIQKEIPWWQLHQIAKQLGGELKKHIEEDSHGNVIKKIVIEYKEEK